ncbi:TetR/AcrR family transcriptional regulator [Antrihabitans sp. YC2-6]|uniref:TetR/AcrR family transcriptional regulator n=1 Tax=Antrihabitans sp. YC2-6 TaxID=2799498 RepID=UPI0018F5FC24|nr:TetR/AcrR family transcriptional regulator [Antrihabitans sp. YC2-6]MBJ8346973.1 TetR/AcrR family transcriptional regulator [Antrihabitans sp. YC2-6]
MITASSRSSTGGRREQLVGTAFAILRSRGADGLTLPMLADACGVSRPTVYNYFGGRTGLLLTLYQRLYDGHYAALVNALQPPSDTLEEIARGVAAALLDCAADRAEFDALTAALKGHSESEQKLLGMFDRYVEAMYIALLPHSCLGPPVLRLRCIGLLGAARAVGAELAGGRTTRDEAAAAVVELFMCSLNSATAV